MLRCLFIPFYQSENQISSEGTPIHFLNSLAEIRRLFDRDIQKIIKENDGKESFFIPINHHKKNFFINS